MPTLYCSKCGYNLTALTENRCPECGEWFDPLKIEAMQREGISTRSVILQLIFVPIVFAVLTPICLVGSLSADVAGIVFSGIVILGLIVLHAWYLSRAYVNTRRLQDGEDNVPWFCRRVWACCVLLAFTEAILTFMYFAGGCAVVLMNMSFH